MSNITAGGTRRRPVDPRWWLAVIGAGLAVFWVLVGVAAVSYFAGSGDPTELGKPWPVVTRCTVVQPEDLDRPTS